MVLPLAGIKNRDGKVTGSCWVCSRSVAHLERHHIRYRPEVCVDICHRCHHRIHFLQYQLSESDIKRMLTRVYPSAVLNKYSNHLKELMSFQLNHKNFKGMPNLNVAPSRSAFIERLEKKGLVKPSPRPPSAGRSKGRNNSVLSNLNKRGRK